MAAEEEEYCDIETASNIKTNTVQNMASKFGPTTLPKPDVGIKPTKSVLNRFPHAGDVKIKKTPPIIAPKTAKPTEDSKDQNQNIKNNFGSAKNGGKGLTATTSFQEKSRVSGEYDNRLTQSDGTMKQIGQSNEILNEVRSRLKPATDRQSMTNALIAVTRQRSVNDSVTPPTISSTNDSPLRNSVTNRFVLHSKLVTRDCDNKRFKLINKSTLISNYDAPMKYRRQPDMELKNIVDEYNAAVADIGAIGELDEFYEDLSAFSRIDTRPVSLIPEMSEDEELRRASSRRTQSPLSGHAEEDYDDCRTGDDMEQIYEPIDELEGSIVELEKISKEKEKKAKADEKERLKEELRLKEAAKKEEKDRLTREKKENKLKKKQKNSPSDVTDNTTIHNDETTEEVYDVCKEVDVPIDEDPTDDDNYEAPVDFRAQSTETLDKDESKVDRKKREAQEKKDKDNILREEKERLSKEKKEKERRDKELKELKKKFKFDGESEAITEGEASEDMKGGKLNLELRANDKVSIMRMSDNPSGKWLAKTPNDKWGYVDSNKITIPTDIIKQVSENI